MINSSLFSEREMRGEGNLMEILTVRRQTADLLFVLRNKDYSLLSLSLHQLTPLLMDSSGRSKYQS